MPEKKMQRLWATMSADDQDLTTVNSGLQRREEHRNSSFRQPAHKPAHRPALGLAMLTS